MTGVPTQPTGSTVRKTNSGAGRALVAVYGIFALAAAHIALALANDTLVLAIALLGVAPLAHRRAEAQGGKRATPGASVVITWSS